MPENIRKLFSALPAWITGIVTLCGVIGFCYTLAYRVTALEVKVKENCAAITELQNISHILPVYLNFMSNSVNEIKNKL